MEIGQQVTGNEMPLNLRRRRRKYPTTTSQSHSRRQLPRQPTSRQQRLSSHMSSDSPGARPQQPLLTAPTSTMNRASCQGRHRFAAKLLAAIVVSLAIVTADRVLSSNPHESNLRFDPQTSAYQGLTFTFDPRLDKQVEQRLHFEHWLDIMQQASSLLYESLNGHAHLAEIKVLIPFKWRQLSAELRPVLYKPGAPVIANRRLRFAQSDVIVGLEDPIYKETPFAVQHDECGRPGLNIRVPISFLDQQQQQSTVTTNKLGSGQTNLDARLKARQFVREFASHRYGVFKESGFRSDFMYPPFSSPAGLELDSDLRWPLNETRSTAAHLELPARTNRSEQWDFQGGGGGLLRGFDEHFRECKFEASPASGLPANAQAANCLPYLAGRPQLNSFNLMASDPFSYGPMIGGDGSGAAMPVQWQELAEQTRWHFCGENFATNSNMPQAAAVSPGGATSQSDQSNMNGLSSSIATASNHHKLVHYEHNQRAANKQNRMCQERSALEVIQMSEDFSKPVSPANFNRLPKPSFTFLQEMPPRVILCLEYTSHLFLSRQQVIGSAINKFLALDLVTESELAMVVFGQHQSRVLGSSNFRRLDSNQEARLLLFNPSFEVFDDQLIHYSAAELSQMDVQTVSNNQQQPPVKILKGSCSLAKMMAEVNGLLQKGSQQYDDVGADLVVLTSGLFIEDEQRIEEILRSSNFRSEHNRLNMIIYPSNLLFDTKSNDRLIVLDSNESERIIRARLNKLLLIQKLTGARLHLIREQLDSLGDVKMSTLAQFYQVFNQLASGHSWDQTNALLTLQSQQVDSRQNSNQQQQHSSHGLQAEHKLTFQFNLDESIQNELIVGFMEPKAREQISNMVERQALVAPSQKNGKKFTLKNLQLRSPGGQIVFTETNTSWNLASYNTLYNNNSYEDHQLDSIQQESAWFPFRAQLSLAGFHVRAEQLAQLAVVKKLAGTWTLSALSDEPLQTSGIAMARANPQGDTLMGNCWIQTYNKESIFDASDESSVGGGGLKLVKVFAQISGGVGNQRQEVEARVEIQDEMGNIVQNAQMLDDGLGAPDMTQNDGIFTQYVQRATRSGFYKISVELSTGHSNSANSKLPNLTGPSGQDNVCCGSFIPQQQTRSGQTKSIRSTRQLYCGTFFVDANNRLAQQRPPRISNLTVVNVDQDNRRVSLRWFEPKLDIASGSRVPLASLATGQRFAENSQLLAISSDSDLLGEEAQHEDRPAAGQQAPLLRATRSTRAQLTQLKSSNDGGIRRRQIHGDDSSPSSGQFDEHQDQQLGRNVLMASHQQERSLERPPLQNRYEIKLFFDRDIAKRTFDSKEVAYKFTEWNVEGQFPNASQFGGMKEITLRVPFAREGLYFVAMKVYNNFGQASQMSNIAQFYLRNNMTLDEAESIWNQPGMTVDAEGNVYDKNGDLVQRAGSPSTTNQIGGFLLFKGTSALDGFGVLVLVSVLIFVMVVVCITLVACLASSARHQLKNVAANKASRHSEGDEKKMAGSGSSIVSSSAGCESSEAGTSSLAGSCSGAPAINQNQQQHHHHLLIDQYNSQPQEGYHKIQVLQQPKDQFHYIHHQEQQQQQLSNYTSGPSHTIVNGYTYATVQQPSHQQQQQQFQNHYQSAYSGDMNQNGLDAGGGGGGGGDEPTSWPADVLLSHYDKVKQARERNEAPPVMRIEALEHAGLPSVAHSALDAGTHHHPYYNQALHQQLSSVLKLKRQNHFDPSSSPALDGVTGTATDSDQADGGQAPSAHYLYYATSTGLPQVEENGLANQLTDPSIYSQTTNLQQVQTAPMNKDNLAGYYANQPWSTLAGVQPSASMISSSIYSPSGSATDSQQQHCNGGGGEATISEV